MYTTAFYRQTFERAVKTACQTAAALLGAGAFSIVDIDWAQVAGVSAGAAVLSILTSFGSDPFGPDDSPSLV